MTHPLIIQPQSKIPRAVITSPESFLEQRIKDNNPLTLFNPTKAVLLKYYPKYYRRLYINSSFKTNSILSKVKQVKTIQDFRYVREWDDPNHPKTLFKLIRILLQTKRKSIQSPGVLYCPNRHDSDCLVHGMDICHLFPRIKQLSAWTFTQGLDLERNTDYSSRLVQKRILKAHQYFWDALRYLKDFHIPIDSDDLWVLLQRLQSAQRFLSSLETFHFWLCCPYKPEDSKAFFEFVLKHQGLLKHVTHITFTGQLDFRYDGSQAKLILDSCPKLRGISFLMTIKRETEETRLQECQENSCLSFFKSLQNITVLILAVNNVWSLIEGFEFPPQLESLTIEFCCSDWHVVWADLYPEIQNDNDPAIFESYEKHRVLLNFFAKFKQLTHLKSFRLIIDQLANPNEIVANFLLPLLRSIPKLETFECEFITNDHQNKNSPLDLSVFLDGIAPLKHLKSFKISKNYGRYCIVEVRDLIITWNPQKNFAFSNIPSINIDAWISPEFNFKQFLRNIPLDHTKKEMNFSKISLQSIDSFIEMLTEFNNVEQLSPLKINLGVLLRLDSLQDIFTSFRYPIALARNLTIKLEICIPPSHLFLLQSQEKASLQNIFRSFRFSIIQANRSYE